MYKRQGLDPNTAEEAVNRACQLIEELGAGEVVGGIIDIYPVKKVEKRIPFNADKINKLLGTDLPEETMLGYFKTIELKYDPETREVIAPTWRQDLERMADLAEDCLLYTSPKPHVLLTAVKGEFQSPLPDP